MATRRAPFLFWLLLILSCGEGPAASGDAPGDPGAGPTAEPAPTAGPAPWWEHPGDDPDPPTARRQLAEDLRAGRDAERHPGDGGGRVWLEPVEGTPDPIPAGTTGRWRLVYEAGPLGVSAEGAVYLHVSPFWGWSEPFGDPDGRLPASWRDGRPGFTSVSSDVPGLVTRAVHLDQTLMAILFEGRGLEPGERLEITYGAGAAGARADRYAGRESPFWIAVDADGDGLRELVPDCPTVDVSAGPPARLVAQLPSCLSPGEEGRLTVAALDATGSSGVDWSGTLELLDRPEGSDLPATIALDAAAGARLSLPFTCTEEGLVRLRLRGPDGLETTTNPLVVQQDVEPILWGDLHGHSGLSDGTGTPEDYFAYARDVAGLDVIALTDHDHWGTEFLDAHPEHWQRIRDAVAAHHEPGCFVTLLGYEWTNWIHGHRHVLSFAEQPELEVLSSLDERYETPRQLWDALRGRDVLTFAHHSAGAPVPVNWTYRPDPVLEPVTEVISVHGSSEALDAPFPIARPVPGNFVRDVLLAGERLGFIGSGDSHDGHPGLAHLANPGGCGGLVAFLTGDRTRAGVLAALRQRRVYATSGARMILRASLDGRRLGATLEPPEGPARLTLLVRGSAPLEAVDLIRSGVLVDRLDLEPEQGPDLVASWTLDQLGDGEFVYLRVHQRDGHCGWTSPFFVDAGD